MSLDFESKSEPWATYELEDGSIVKVRSTVTGVARLDGEFDGHGNPVYSIQSKIDIRVAKAKIRGQPTAPSSATQALKKGPEVG